MLRVSWGKDDDPSTKKDQDFIWIIKEILGNRMWTKRFPSKDSMSWVITFGKYRPFEESIGDINYWWKIEGREWYNDSDSIWWDDERKSEIWE